MGWWPGWDVFTGVLRGEREDLVVYTHDIVTTSSCVGAGVVAWVPGMPGTWEIVNFSLLAACVDSFIWAKRAWNQTCN